MLARSSGLLATAATVPIWWEIVEIVALAIIIVPMLLLLGGVAYVSNIASRRLRRLHDETMRDVADAQSLIALPDDGQTITVYAQKSGVEFYLVVSALASGIFTAGGVWMSIDPRYRIVVVVLALLALLFGVVTVLAAARLISRAPVLIVNAEGITDNATLIATGVGVIPWREILGLRIQWARFLTIEADNHAIFREQALWKRALLALVRSPDSLVRIHEFLLPMPLEELRAQIEEYARAHGHTLPLAAVSSGADPATRA